MINFAPPCISRALINETRYIETLFKLYVDLMQKFLGTERVILHKYTDGTGYANHNYLLIPLLAPNTAEDRRHNSSHIKTRNPLERLFGVQKRRFPILLYGCRLKVETFLNITVAAAVLHNRALLLMVNLWYHYLMSWMTIDSTSKKHRMKIEVGF
nr:unnamed protein product [Callosobruchus chinensis]